MQVSQVPAKIPEPFANSGSKNTIPDTSTSPAASWSLGFPPATFAPIGSGGVPPDGKDMNGALFTSTGWAQWFSAGGPILYDGAFSTTVGGYPKGAMVQGATPGNFFISTVDNNTAVASTLVNWVTLNSVILASPAITGSGTAATQPANTSNTTLANTFYADRSATTAGAAAVTSANSFTSTQLAQYLPLIGGNLTGNLGVIRDGEGIAAQLSISGDNGQNRALNFETGSLLRFNWFVNTETEVGAAGGANMLLAAYLNTGAFLGNVAKIFRNTQIWQFFQSPIVPNLSASDNSSNVPNTIYVDRQALVNNIGPMSATSSPGITIGASFNQTRSLTFTAPCKGTVFATGCLNVSDFSSNAIASGNITATLSINGTGVGADTTPTPQFHQGFLAVASGATVTVSINVVTTTMPTNAKGTFSCGCVFIPTL